MGGARAQARLGVGFVLTLLALVAATACGNPAGVDGQLTDDWAPPAAPVMFQPEAGTCHPGNFAEVGTRQSYETVSCDLPHRTETVYVGSYPGPAAMSAVPPAEGSAGARAAYRECDARTTTFVGASWRLGRLWIGVVQPSAMAWAGGARWFRCDVVEVSSIEDDGGVVERTGSLRDALRLRTSPLRLTCYTVKLAAGGAIDSMPAASCTSRHNAEFVGVWFAGERPYPRGSGWKAFHTGCRRIVAAYVRVPVDANLQYRTGVLSLPGGPDVWAAGDHSVRCYLWVEGTNLRTSLKGRGPKALPIQYE